MTDSNPAGAGGLDGATSSGTGDVGDTPGVAKDVGDTPGVAKEDGTAGDGAGATGETGATREAAAGDADATREDRIGESGRWVGSGDSGAGDGRPSSVGMGLRTGRPTAWSTTGLPAGGDNDGPSVIHPIRAQSSACPTTRATATRTVRRTARVTGTGSTRRTL